MSDSSKPFIRHSHQLISHLGLISASRTLKPSLCDTLIAIATHWNPRNEVFPSQSRIAELSGIHRRTVITHVKKLVDIGVIATEERPNAPISQFRASLNYIFNDSVIKVLTTKAKKALKIKANKSIAKARKTRENDHTPHTKNDHIKQPSSLHSEGELKTINTVSKKIANRFNLKDLFESLQHEVAHRAKLAYKAGTYAAQVKRGEIFSKAELANRAERAKRTRALNESLSAQRNEQLELAKLLMTDTAIKPAITEQQIMRLIELVGGESNLNGLGAMLPFKLKQFRARQTYAAKAA